MVNDTFSSRYFFGGYLREVLACWTGRVGTDAMVRVDMRQDFRQCPFTVNLHGLPLLPCWDQMGCGSGCNQGEISNFLFEIMYFIVGTPWNPSSFEIPNPRTTWLCHPTRNGEENPPEEPLCIACGEARIPHTIKKYI